MLFKALAGDRAYHFSYRCWSGDDLGLDTLTVYEPDANAAWATARQFLLGTGASALRLDEVEERMP